MSLSQEQVPNTIEDEVLREFLNRRFVDIGIQFENPPVFPTRHEMPYKPKIGNMYYFGDPLTHDYDPAITEEGWWGMKSTGWVLIA
jgi:hypothetical protein